MNLLSDPPRSLYFVLIAAVLLPLLAAIFLFPKSRPRAGKTDKNSSRRKLLFVVSGIALLLLTGLIVCDQMLESDAEQITRKLKEMSAGVRERNMTKVFQHVSQSFRYGSAGRDQLRRRGEDAQRAGQVDEIPMWDINVEPIAADATAATVIFRFKVVGNALQGNQFLCRARFVKDPDGQWRLQDVEVFPPTGLRDAYQIPGL